MPTFHSHMLQLMSSPTSPGAIVEHSILPKYGALQPERRRGRLIALKTMAELQQAHVQSTQVYITAIPLKAASTTLKFACRMCSEESY